MDKPERSRIANAVKSNHRAYLARIAGSKHAPIVTEKLSNLRRKLQAQLRKIEGSTNSLEGIPNLARLVFGLHEDLRRLRLPPLSFEREISEINRFIISALELRMASNYADRCGSYGEVLLNCYLDIFVTLTVLKTPREFEAKPGFLVYPVSGSVLEIDIMLEDFRLGFEFQGEHHYTDSRVQAKDSFKLAAFATHERVLIPVNIAQLNGRVLQTLIVNSIKDHLRLHELLVTKDPTRFLSWYASGRQLLQFSKATQRIYLSRVLFGEALTWLDSKANEYIAVQGHRSPISSNSDAPRQSLQSGDLEVDYIYHNLKYVTKARRQCFSA